MSRSRSAAAVALVCLTLATTASAGGPRFISGTVGFSIPGQRMAFYTNQPLYYTDPGDLSPTVTSAQADAMVAAAAAVWNMPQTSLVLAQGGKLNEHVSSANTTFTSTGLAFPADVQATNYLAKPIAIVYDTDGSIINLLLGEGASNPSGCRQNGVVESVDAFAYTPAINHAVIVLNGLCVNSASARTQQLMQMQYQLMRVFARILGLSWSQLNDNVFTGTPAPTAVEMSTWPLLHPIDILCGPYSYQCMQAAFTPRYDDIAALGLLYPNGDGPLPAGKQPTYLYNGGFYGPVTFPTGQGAELINMVVKRWAANTNGYEPYPLVSGVTGDQFQQNGGNPVTGTVPDSLNAGANDNLHEATFTMGPFPLTDLFSNIDMRTEGINPLYIGDYAVGPYQRPPITPPGPTQDFYWYTLGGSHPQLWWGLPLTGTPTTCNPVGDGTESGPATADPSGWWSGLLCGVGHASWFVTPTIKAGHTWTLEATALNAAGQPTLNAVQPVLGVWNATDPTGTLPTVAAAPAAMNSLALGTTQLKVDAASADASFRIVVADQYGGGRPDFTYTGRVLYADSVTPAQLPLRGGQITITGTGFRANNTVSVNGVRATVVSWTSTQIVATTPSAAAAGAGSGAVDVLVRDASTGGTTDIPAAITYLNIAPNDTVTITTPTAYLAAGAGAQWTVSLSAASSGSPDAGAPVAWSTTSTPASPGLTLSAQQTATSTGGVATSVAKTAAIAAGSTNTVTGCVWSTLCATWTAYGVDPSQWLIALARGGGQSVAATAALQTVTFQVTDTAGHPLPGASVSIYQTSYAWQVVCTTARCPSAPVLATSQTSAVSDTNGQVAVAPLQVPGVAQTVAIAAATGTPGFATTTLTVHP
jgi:hypothetical protein